MDEFLYQEAQKYLQALFSGDHSGHDAAHSLRVYRLATRLQAEEGGNLSRIQLSALLHDADDHKLFPDTCESLAHAVDFMTSHALPATEIEAVCAIIRTVSFSKGQTPATLEGKIVQDADRLDAIGAIGIARTFAFGGSHARALYAPEAAQRTDSVQHFYDKLLRLKDLMNTPAAQRLAQARHQYMVDFLEQFYAEWAGER